MTSREHSVMETAPGWESVSTASIAGLEDEDIVATMYGPWHNGGDSVREQRVEFWRRAIEEVSLQHNFDTVSLHHLLSWFQSNAVRPRCLPDVLSVLMTESHHHPAALMSISQLRTRTPPPSASSSTPSTPKKLLNVMWKWGSNAVGALLSSPTSSRPPAVDSNEPLIVLRQAFKRGRSLWAQLTSRVDEGASWVDKIITLNDPIMIQALQTASPHMAPVAQSHSLSLSDLLRLMRLESSDRRLVFDASGEVIGILASSDAALTSLSQPDCDRVGRVKLTLANTQSRIQQLDADLISVSKTIMSQKSKNPAAKQGLAASGASLKPLLHKRIYLRKYADKLRVVSANLKEILENIASSSDNIVLVSTLKDAHAALQSVNQALSSVATPDSVEDLLGEVRSAIDDQADFSNSISDSFLTSPEDELELQSEYDLLEMQTPSQTTVRNDDASLLAELEALTVSTSAPSIPKASVTDLVHVENEKQKQRVQT
jgi:hypothetical protein